MPQAHPAAAVSSMKLLGHSPPALTSTGESAERAPGCLPRIAPGRVSLAARPNSRLVRHYPCRASPSTPRWSISFAIGALIAVYPQWNNSPSHATHRFPHVSHSPDTAAPFRLIDNVEIEEDVTAWSFTNPHGSRGGR